MADEVLKIVFEEGGSASGGPRVPSGGDPRRSAASQFDPIKEAQRMLDEQQRKAMVTHYKNLMEYGDPNGPAPKAFDPAARAADIRVQQSQRKAVEAELFDPAARARDIMEGEDRKKAVEAELKKLRPQEGPNIRGTIASATQAAGQLGAQAGIPGAGVLGSVGGAIGAAGPAAAAMAAAAAAILTIRMIDSKVRQVADDAGRYSVEAQAAMAMSEIRRVQGDLRRSQEVGPSLAKLVDAESRLDESIRDLFTSPEWLEFKTQVVESLLEIVKIVGPIVKWFGKNAPDMLAAMFPKLAMAVTLLNAIKNNTDPELRDTGDVFLTQFLNQDFGQIGDGRDEVTESSRRLVAEQLMPEF